MYLKATPCPSGNAGACATAQQQTYAGRFNTHVTPFLASTQVSVSLYVENTSEAAAGIQDKLVATVRLFGYAISGATVNFTAENVSTGAVEQYVSISPQVSTTNSAGQTTAYASTTTPGLTKIVASFAGYSASAIINFTVPVYVTFSAYPSLVSSSTVLTVDNVNYSSSQLPVTFGWTQGSRHTYKFVGTVPSSPSTRYVLNSVSGCGQTESSGYVVAVANCTTIGVYKTQYYLSMSSIPGSLAGSITPNYPGEWLNQSTTVTISATPNPHYLFSGWTGTGAGSYTGSSPSHTITISGPISEVANFYSSTTSTTTSTSTSTSSSSTTIFKVTTSTTTSTAPTITVPKNVTYLGSCDNATIESNLYAAVISGWCTWSGGTLQVWGAGSTGGWIGIKVTNVNTGQVYESIGSDNCGLAWLTNFTAPAGIYNFTVSTGRGGGGSCGPMEGKLNETKGSSGYVAPNGGGPGYPSCSSLNITDSNIWGLSNVNITEICTWSGGDLSMYLQTGWTSSVNGVVKGANGNTYFSSSTGSSSLTYVGSFYAPSQNYYVTLTTGNYTFKWASYSPELELT